MEMKERIIEKANELFTKYGIKCITMDEIASQLGISKKTIYQSFADKNELVSVVLHKHIDYARQLCLSNIEKSENAVHELVLARQMFCSMMQYINVSVLHDLQKYHPEVFTSFEDFRKKFLFNCILQNLQRGISEKVYRDDIDVEIMSRLRLANVVISMDVELFPTQKFRFSDVEEEVVRHFLYGIVTAKGAKMMKKYNESLNETQGESPADVQPFHQII